MPETSAIAATPVSYRRRMMNQLVTCAAAGAVILVLLPLIAIFTYLIIKGIGSLNWAFLTQTPKPVGEPGGGVRRRPQRRGFHPHRAVAPSVLREARRFLCNVA